MSEGKGRALDWNDTIENDDGAFQVIPDGIYNFVVKNFERGRFDGSEKMDPCPMAILSLDIYNVQNQYVGSCQKKLFLNTNAEAFVCAFFRSINLRKHGEKMAMDWNAIHGSKGRCNISTNKWIGRNNKKYEGNEVDFLDPLETQQQPAQPQQGYAPQPQQQQQQPQPQYQQPPQQPQQPAQGGQGALPF